MTIKPRVVVDPHFRTMQEIFSPADHARLHAIVEVIWGRDEPMPLDKARAALEDAIAIVSSGWRYGELPDGAATLRAIIDVSGGFPITLDYPRCFPRLWPTGRRDGPEYGAGGQPRDRGRRSRDAHGRGALEPCWQCDHLPALRSAGRVDRFRQHRPLPAAAAGAVRLSDCGLRPVARRRVSAQPGR